jgi:phage anti-repressor protein
MDLTPEAIFGLLKSTDNFVVDLDDAWQWIGWREKRDAKDVLTRNFEEGVDFSGFGTKSSSGGRPSEWILLTTDCFKSLAMMAGTSQGKAVRKHFLDCEKQLKDLLQRTHEIQRQRLLKLIVQDQPDSWTKQFEDEFFDEAYRIQGWKRPQKGHLPCMGSFINDAIYDRMPNGVSNELRRVNPKNTNGNRSRKHHQHLTGNFGFPILATQKAATIAVMRLSPSNRPDRFKANMLKACGTSIQLELLDFDDFDEAS